MQKRTSAHSGTMVTLDDAEMALTLVDLEKTAIVTYAVPEQSYDLLCELQSAASMIMDKEECEVLVREFEAAKRSHATAA